jgi:hypothetical protein
MAARTRPVSRPAPGRYCGQISYGADGDGAVHECCLAWRRVMSFGYPCPACQIYRIVLRTGRLPDRPPPLPATLPDGTPFVPDLTPGQADGRCPR